MAWAVEITEENVNVIVSEGGTKLDRQGLLDWIEDYGDGGGYFVRDDESFVMDCSLFTPLVFFRIYKFRNEDSGALFREVVKIASHI